jgi:peptide/nickel transport system substrate-binding protein/oligopeptide transport system substrate-binding protein
MFHPLRLALLTLLWICYFLFGQGACSATELSERSGEAIPGTKFGGTFRQALGDNPSTLDPTVLTDIYGRAVVSQIFDALVQFDAKLNPIPALAEFWEASPDGRTWTFVLRQGVKFHHGREMTVHDVVYTFTRLLTPTNPLSVNEIFQSIQGAKAFLQGKAPSIQGLKILDRYTLQIVLDKPLAPSLVVLGLAFVDIVPQDVVEQQGEHFGHAPVGTGPFRFVRWVPDQEIVLEANDHYHEGRPYLDAVVFKIFVGSKAEESFGEFLQGNLEETIIPTDMIEKVGVDPVYQKYQQFHNPMLNLIYIGFNTQRGPFADRRVRQAFNYAVNTEAIAQGIAKQGSLVAHSILPPGMPGHTPDLSPYAYDLAKAQHLLAEAGYPGGAGLPVVQIWSVHKAESTKAELAAYQTYLADLGVKTEVHFASDWPAYKKMLEQGELSMFRLAWYADIPDPDNFLPPLLYSTSPTNRTFYQNPVVDQLLEQARHELDYARRIAIYHEVDRMVMDDAPWILQHHSVTHYLYQPYVQDVQINYLGKHEIPLKKVWFQKNLSQAPTGVTSVDKPSP